MSKTIKGGEKESRECPNCHSKQIWKDGIRKTRNGFVQRFLCRDCVYRFSDNPYKQCQSNNNHQLCVIKKAKKLDNPTKIKIVAVDKKNTQKGQIIQFCFHLKKQGYAETTIKLRYSVLKVLMERGADLDDPEIVKEVIARQPWSQNRKRNVIASYTKFLNYQGLTWNPPKCNVIRKLPYVPKEKEIDSLVAGCSRNVAIFLQLLKETGMRSGEAIAITWIDVDNQKRTITCNMPEKGSNPRVIGNISKKLFDMLNSLPKKNKQVFGFTTQNSLKAMFTRERKRITYKLQNPRLQEIHFHTMRYWRGTLEYHRTHDLLRVKKLLGHKDIRNTELYIDLETREYAFSEDNFHTAIANNVKEACKLIESGFEFITGEYSDGGKIFRKRK